MRCGNSCPTSWTISSRFHCRPRAAVHRTWGGWASHWIQGSLHIFVVDAAGVQQGDPLGPAFFSLALALSLRGTEAAPATPAPFEVWYLDDGVATPRDRPRSQRPQVEAIALDGQAQQAGELPWTSLEAAELLGVPCGLQTAAASEKVLATVVRHLGLLGRVATYDPHAAFTLARHCGGFAAANYLLRALGPSTVSPELGVPLEHLRRVNDAVVSFVGSLAGALSTTGSPDLPASSATSPASSTRRIRSREAKGWEIRSLPGCTTW
eukprot:PhM_4_TR11668/c1_g3_i3/m.64015